MKKLPKELLALIGLVVVIIALLLATSIHPQKSESDDNTQEAASQSEEQPVAADVDPEVLPAKSAVADILGFEPVQVDKLTDEFVFRSFETRDTGVTYGYQKHLAANATRLFLKIDKMSEDDYKASLPAESVAENVEVSGRNAVFAERSLYRVPEGEEVDSVIAEMVENGEAIVETSDIYREYAPIETLDWYENGCKFEIYAERQGFTKEEMVNLANYYFSNAE
jgi:hypothetical protein